MAKPIDLTNPALFTAWVIEVQSLTLLISKVWFPKWTMKKGIKRLVFLVKNGSQYLEHASSKLPNKDLALLTLINAESLLLKKRLY
jgi:hypothetical protein